MEERTIRYTERILMEKQYQRSLVISGYSLGNKSKAQREFDRLKAWALRMGLDMHVHPNAIDPFEFQHYSDRSDRYKDLHGIRPSERTTYAAMKRGLKMWDRIETPDLMDDLDTNPVADRYSSEWA